MFGIVVDTLGLPHAIHITCANITDRESAQEMIARWCHNMVDTSNLMPKKKVLIKETA